MCEREQVWSTANSVQGCIKKIERKSIMGITVNTNMQALRIQRNLNGSTTKMNAAMERMSSGYKINKAKDDAAGYAVAATLGKTISGSKIAKDNVSMGDDLLTTTSGTLTVVQQNLQRVRDLTEQAANGTYSTQDLKGIASEVRARLEQIDEMSRTTTFNGKKLLDYLSKSPFVTFYSAKNVFDNYAEEITMPYLYNQFGINYKVKYLKNGKVAAEYNLAEKVTR